ncbi:hypothetical protein ACLMJK_005095 [Lecanora helva]
MSRCKGIVWSGTPHENRCMRDATAGFAFCWTHAPRAKSILNDLDTSGADDPAFALQHLAYRGSDFEGHIIKTNPVSAPSTPQKALYGDRDGISLGNLEVLPLEILWAIISELSISSVQNLKATNSRTYLTVSTSPQ